MGLHPTKEQQEKALVSTMVHILSQVTTLGLIIGFQLTQNHRIINIYVMISPVSFIILLGTS